MKKRVLLSIMTLVAGMHLAPVAGSAAEGERARELFRSLGCQGCHQLEGQGGTLGPSLDGVGQLDQEQIRQEMVDPKADDPNSMMPSFKDLPPADLQAMIDFLSGLK